MLFRSSPRDAGQLARLIVVAYPGVQVMIRAGASKERIETAIDVILGVLDDPRPALG